MSSAGVGEEIIDNDYTWPVPWQLFQLMCVCVRLWGALGSWEEGERRGEKHKHMKPCLSHGINQRGTESRQAETKVCHFRIDVKGNSQFKILLSASKQKKIWLHCDSQPFTESFMQRKGGSWGVWNINRNSTLHIANTAPLEWAKKNLCSCLKCRKALLQHTPSGYFGHKGQNLRVDGLMSVEALFVSSLSMSPYQPSPQAWKPYQANKDSPAVWSSSHPSDYSNSTYRRALFRGVLTLNGQRNYHKQLLFYSERERLTFVHLSLRRHCWHTDKTPMSDLLKEIYTNMQRNTSLPFWVCPSSMSSSIVLILFF